tara:strand:- start:853 stop:1026 length:174 start_codon:yes stop_codon:yes gene_type:complete
MDSLVLEGLLGCNIISSGLEVLCRLWPKMWVGIIAVAVIPAKEAKDWPINLRLLDPI